MVDDGKLLFQIIVQKVSLGSKTFMWVSFVKITLIKIKVIKLIIILHNLAVFNIIICGEHHRRSHECGPNHNTTKRVIL